MFEKIIAMRDWIASHGADPEAFRILNEIAIEWNEMATKLGKLELEELFRKVK